jgi:hypothetical protein
MLSSKSHPITAASHEMTNNIIGTQSRVTYQVSAHDQKRSKKKSAPQCMSLVDRHNQATCELKETVMRHTPPQQLPPARAASAALVLASPKDWSTMSHTYSQVVSAPNSSQIQAPQSIPGSSLVLPARNRSTHLGRYFRELVAHTSSRHSHTVIVLLNHDVLAYLVQQACVDHDL